MGQGLTLTPQQQAQQYLQYIQEIQNSPLGQQAMAAQQQTIAMNVKTALANIENQRKQLEIQEGTAKANAWAQKEQVKLAQQAHELAQKVAQQNYEIQSGQLTGTFNGAPTLASLAQQAQYTGQYQGAPTLQAINQEQQFGLQQGGLTGMYQGAPTLAAQNQQQQYGLQLGAQTGYQGGQATLEREQAAANTALQAAQLGASLRGPGDWAQYLQAMNGVAGSPASALVQSVPGGMGAPAGQGPGPMTLASVLGAAGMTPQQGGGGQSVLHGGGTQGTGATTDGGTKMYAGGGGGFNERTGQYGQASSGPTGQRVAATGGINESGGQPTAQYNLMGTIGQVAQAARPTNAQLGLTDQEAAQLKGYFNNPGSAPGTWYSSKSSDERAYLQGLNQHWGGSPATFVERERNARPRQQSVWSA